jgi:uncharacterized protein YjbI with pentapeptide repeats
MNLSNALGNVLFTSNLSVSKDVLIEAVKQKANLSGADLSGADLSGANLSGADLYGADLYGANLRGANLRGADGKKKKAKEIRIFSGLYNYVVFAVLFEDGERWIRMGCLCYSLKQWNKIGIRKSNLSEFPDDGSFKSEERIRAFNFAKATVLALK